MRYSVDRIENNTAVLIDEEKNRYTVAAALLPDAAKQGSVLVKSDGGYRLDEQETRRRKDRLYKLQKRLFSEKNLK